jgi:hypothetical protein
MRARAWTSALVAAVIVGSVGAIDAVDPLTEFNDSVGRYVSLRARLEAPLPSFTSPRGGRSGFLAQRYLAAAIRTARRGAGRGDLFTPDVAVMFRTRLAGVLTPAERIALPGVPAGEEGTPLLLVNEPVAPEWLAELPPRAIQALPALPDGLEYRLVDVELVLWDAHAEIVVDVLPDAVH